MANPEHLAILEQGGEAWNAWRRKSGERPDLSGANFIRAHLCEANLSGTSLTGADLAWANLTGANLSGADLSGANLPRTRLFEANLSEADLSETNLCGAFLFRANLSGAVLLRANLTMAELTSADISGAVLSWAGLSRTSLTEADLAGANLFGANLFGANLFDANLFEAELSEADLGCADLSWANLTRANLTGANLTGANLMSGKLIGVNLTRGNLTGANLERAMLLDTILHRAELRNCRVFATSVWRAELEGASQKDLIITEEGEPPITVDNLEVAQFIHLLLHNDKVRDVIDTIGRKAVLILGRFTPERKSVLDRLREELRRRGYLPILFDFSEPAARDTTETIRLLAGMSRFVIADLTDPKSIQQELTAIKATWDSVPVQPVLLRGHAEWSMFVDLQRGGRVLPPYVYEDPDALMAALGDHVIAPAERRADELREELERLRAEAVRRRALPEPGAPAPPPAPRLA